MREYTKNGFLLRKELRAGNLSGTQATSTYRNGLRRTVNDCLYLADVGLPYTVGLTMGVRNTLTVYHAFSTNTALCHIGHLLIMDLRPVEQTDNSYNAPYYTIFLFELQDFFEKKFENSQNCVEGAFGKEKRLQCKEF